jgi:hypothetical protein
MTEAAAHTKIRQPERRKKGTQRSDRLWQLYLFLTLALVVLFVLLSATVFQEDSRIFLLKIIAAALLSILPGWIYLQFIRNRGHSLYDEYVLNLFRLHIDEFGNLPAPPRHTSWYQVWKKEHDQLGTPDPDNLYRRKFESIYGRHSVSTIRLITDSLSFKDRTETFAPVIMATIIFALAWTLIVEPELVRSIRVLGETSPLSGRPILPVDALRFGFLGAYGFLILDLGRRYYRDDLKSSAYISATMRIVFASLLIVAIDAAVDPPRRSELLVAFFIGFFPRAGFTWLRLMVPDGLRALLPTLESDYPLDRLEGLNVWYEARLLEEGIESMQHLCSANLVDLMLRTRAPVSRLVDWLDQAFLHLHLPKPKDQPSPAIAKLRRLGIRTATDLERVCKRPKIPDATHRLLAEALDEKPEDVEAVVSAILRSLEGEPNLWHVRQFRRHDWLIGIERQGRAPAPSGNGAGRLSSDEPPNTSVDLQKDSTGESRSLTQHE